MTRRIAAALALVTMFVVAEGCTKSVAPTARPSRCTPGNYVFCRCKDRSEGTKLCNDDGETFGPCEGCLGGTDNVEGDPEPPPDDEPPPPPPVDSGAKEDASPQVDAGPTPPPRPKTGELFITEIMFDPTGSEPAEEWLEVFSIATGVVSLNGLLLRDASGRTHGIPASPAVLLEPGTHKLLVRNRPAAIATGLPASAIVFEYGTGDPDTGGVLLSNSATGAISILDGGTEVVKVAFGAFGFTQSPPGGASIQLKVPNAAQAAQKSGWCLSTVAFAGQPASKNPKDLGTPGKASSCP
ncbi:MAG: lamin tail domain-containing protein [Deltaproteobacteria bacterium]|nr:lamin tail domain-containing protein [Deltaproteobacteria bacterium]